MLYIDLVTDITLGFEFDRISVQIGSTGEFPLRIDVPPEPSADYVRGHRLISRPSPPPGEVRVRVNLTLRGAPVAERDVVVSLGESSTSITVVISRDCRGVECPASGNPTLDTCLAGECVDPRCAPETPQFCPPPGCDVDGDCTAPACADGFCSSGTCLASPVHERCPPRMYCDGTSGCQPAVMSADAGNDSGASDAGHDGGLPDMGDDAETTPESRQMGVTMRRQTPARTVSKTRVKPTSTVAAPNARRAIEARSASLPAIVSPHCASVSNADPPAVATARRAKRKLPSIVEGVPVGAAHLDSHATAPPTA